MCDRFIIKKGTAQIESNENQSRYTGLLYNMHRHTLTVHDAVESVYCVCAWVYCVYNIIEAYALLADYDEE